MRLTLKYSFFRRLFKRHPGVIMELSKSEAIWDIVRLIRLKVITYYDLSEFSDKLQQEVKRILEMNR